MLIFRRPKIGIEQDEEGEKEGGNEAAEHLDLERGDTAKEGEIEGAPKTAERCKIENVKSSPSYLTSEFRQGGFQI